MARPNTRANANTVTVEADSLDEALEKAIETANESDPWRSLDHCGDTFVDAVCEGADVDPWVTDASLPAPGRFTEQGDPPIVRPDGGVEVTRSRVLLRFRSKEAT